MVGYAAARFENTARLEGFLSASKVITPMRMEFCLTVPGSVKSFKLPVFIWGAMVPYYAKNIKERGDAQIRVKVRGYLAPTPKGRIQLLGCEMEFVNKE